MPGDSPESPAGKAARDRSRERFRPRRAAWFHWAAAFVLALAPLLYWWFIGPDSYSYGYVLFGDPERCVGNEFMEDHGYEILEVVSAIPLFWFGSLPFVLVSFAAWLIGNLRGRPRIGRIVTWTAVAVVGLVTFPPLLPTLVDAVLDAARSTNCLEMWGGPAILSSTFGQALAVFACLMLMLCAVRRPRARRSAVARVALSLLMVPSLLFLPVSDTVPGLISGFEICHDADGSPIEDLKGEARFLCEIRGGPMGEYGGLSEFADMPDEQVLAYGRHLCAAVARAGRDAYDSSAYEEAGLEYSVNLAQSLEAICPEAVAIREVREGKERLAEERERAALEDICAAYPRHRPLIRPVRRATGTVETDYNALVALEEDEFELIESPPLWVESLVGAEPGVLQVTVAEEFATVCVTAEVYDRRPPLERRGWDEVKEISYRSTRGRLTFVDFYGGRRLIDLTVAGRGDYRVRVHSRGGEDLREGGLEQFLVMIYPSKRR
ncbi:hypothetical protein [Planobispora longispora]|uniref:Uncharacterized protein n=1 Tax=Planobispora longispora TaxID=28887 RepID=A0A8J3RSJ3_9ACTN|nr:hypothetical protein [Planobispora longispora]GIH80318.1 hypothetical protein Plo01_67470 [Planobispora longispora]